MSRLIMGAVVAAACWLTPTPALAAPAWLPPLTIGAVTNASPPAIAVDPAGDAVVVWFTDGPAGRQDIVASYRPAGGAFSPPQAIGVGDQFPGQPPTFPVVAIDRGGNALALWRRIADGVHSRIQSAYRPAGGGWSAVEQLTGPQDNTSDPQVAVDEAGNFTALWLKGFAVAFAEAARRPAGGTFGPAEPASDPGALETALAVGPADDAVAATTIKVTSGTILEVATRLPGGAFGSPQAVSPTSGDASTPRATMAAGGSALALWAQTPPVGLAGSVDAVFSPARGAPFGPRETLSPSNFVSDQDSVAIDGSGNATATWADGPPGSEQSTQVDASVHTTGGWNGLQAVGSGDDLQRPIVAVAPGGEAIIAWEDLGQGTAVAAVRAAGQSAFGLQQTISGRVTPSLARAATDARGNGFVSWRTPDAIQVAGFDPAGPVVGAVQVPPSGSIGQRLDVSASVRDVWSGVASVTWDFGDGSTGSGPTASHAYALPGAWPVELRATDGLGNATVVHRSIQVSADQAAGGSGAPGSSGAPGAAGGQGPPGAPGLPAGVGGDGPAPAQRAAFIARTAIVANGIARLPLYCPRATTAGCFGGMALRLVRAGQVSATAARRLLGTARVAVPAGLRRVVRVRLGRSARLLLARHRRILASASLRLGAVAASPVRRTVLLRTAAR